MRARGYGRIRYGSRTIYCSNNTTVFDWYKGTKAKIFKFRARHKAMVLTNGLNEAVVTLRLF